MNRTYALVWNPTLGAWNVAHEHARRRGKQGALLRRVLALALLGFAGLSPTYGLATDLPTGGQVVLGTGQIGTPSPNQMVIDQHTDKLAINWQTFDIAAGNKVTFNQPGTDSIALNRVLGSDGSTIMGQLDANGRVFLLNPNGILFGADAAVNVGALVASNLSLSDADFAAGNYRFKGDGNNASVINQGAITAAQGGAVALLGGTVSNQGVISAKLGTVALAAGNQVTLDFAGDGLLNVQVDQATAGALVDNRQLIKADGGTVLMTAKASDALLQTVVNNTGVIEAQTLGEKSGKIVLLGGFDGGTVQVAGTLDASAANGGDGGFIETSGANVKVADTVKATTKASSGKTGTWLIDPRDITIAASGGTLTGALAGAILENSNFIISTADFGTDGGNGDIHVNDAISWTSNTTLTLTAERNITINAPITATGSAAGLVLNHDPAGNYNVSAPVTLSGANARLTINGNAYTLIHSMAELDAIDSGDGVVTGYYALAQDLLATQVYDHALVGTSSANAFSGTFAGLGHTIRDLTILAPTDSNVGLFGIASNATIRDIGLLGGSVQGVSSVGGLVGNSGFSTTVSNAYNTGAVTGSRLVGGLIGRNFGALDNAYATGTVAGGVYTGGLVGYNIGTISHAYATGAVSDSGVAVGATMYVGGLVGSNSGTISDVYATGPVTGRYAAGLVAVNDGTIRNAYWDSATSSLPAIASASGPATNLVEINASTRYTHTSYDYLGTWRETASGSGVWVARDVSNNPQWVMIEGSTRPFLYSEWSTTISNAHQLQLMAMNLLAHYTLAGHIDASETSGSNASGMWSTAGFTPVGSENGLFDGSLDGQGHAINGLVIQRGAQSSVGLFGYVAQPWIHDIGLTNSYITGAEYVGGLVGHSLWAIISNAYTTGTVSGVSNVGGLTGSSGGSISNVYSASTVSASDQRAGGLIGTNNGVLTNAYATGAVSGTSYVGGLVGVNSGNVSNAYTTGSVTGLFYVGGWAGLAQGSINNVFYATTDQGGQPINVHLSANSGTGKTWAELTQLDTFAGWSIDDAGGTGSVWRIYDGYTTPLLRSFLTAVTVSADPASLTGKTYDGSAASGTFSYSTDLSNAVLNGTGTYATTSANAGTYSVGNGWLKLGGLYSGQQGYDISYASPNASLTIDKAALTAIVNGANKTYNGQAWRGGNGVFLRGFVNGETYLVLGGSVTYGGTAQGATNAGSYSISASGFSSDNYAITYVDGTLNIGKAALTVTANNAHKTYDGLAWSGGNGVSYSGFVNGEDPSVLGGTLTYGGTSQGATHAGSYGLGASGYSSGNYAISYVDGSLTIDKAALTVTANNATKTYDGLTWSGGNGVSYNGFVNGEDPSVLGGTLTYGGMSQGATNAGSYGLGASGYSADNYAISYVDGSLTIDKAALTVTANNATKTYDGQAWSGGNGVSYSGFVNGEDQSVLAGTLSYGGTAQGAIDTGSYGLSASGYSADNYAISYIDGALSIDAAPAPTPTPTTSKPSAYTSILASLQAERSESDVRADGSAESYHVVSTGIRLPEGI